MSVMHTGHPGPMITSRALGSTARKPNFAIACSWLPHTCMTATGAWSIWATVRSSAFTSAAARAGSRNFNCDRSISLAIPVLGRCVHLAADVGGHQVVRPRLSQQLLVQLERALDVLLGNAADREADVVEDVVAHPHRAVDEVEPDLAPDAP